MIRVVLIDDTRMFVDGLRTVIDLESDMRTVGVAANGADGLDVVRREHPDVVLMDIRMPLMDGVQATRQIKAELPDTHVIMLTTFTDDEFLFEALKAGAVGYLVKDLPASDLLHAVRTVQHGGALILPDMAARLVAEYARLANAAADALAPTVSVHADQPHLPAAGLTPRETEILKLLARGLSNREIAQQLLLSEGTVKNYVSAIFAKLPARDRAQAVAFALRQGIV